MDQDQPFFASVAIGRSSGFASPHRAMRHWEDGSADEVAMDLHMDLWLWEERDRERGESLALAGRPGLADVRGTVGRQNRENPWQVRD